jgi:hypothetical protein
MRSITTVTNNTPFICTYMHLNKRNYTNLRTFGGIREDYEPKTVIPCLPALF